ncbi:molybdenum ABC transporter substrate-binding protein [Sorangium cellulosum]|uniref:Molybdenum ABC transporter substrate-binding protein n=1 Tax=Sorangium cellulosum TaxID=56 RepID=A0A150QPN0_SORCE|nr:molybdenum ABC transporter substrate-binding protein [Sorangium cellulosum]
MRRSRRCFLLCLPPLALAACVVSGVGCGRAEPAPAKGEDRLVVFAAASLRDVFAAMGEDFERAHAGVEVTFNFAGTQELRAQLEHGAAADVFASADQRHMDELVGSGRAVSPVVFARNEPVIVVARESAGAIRGLADLPAASRIVLGAPEVPIGRYTEEILDRASASLGADFRARVEGKVVSRELSVRQVLTKVRLGEAQAGVVYRTDAQAAQDGVALVAIPPEINVVAEYPIAVVAGAAHPGLARAWVDVVLSEAGQSALRRAGFLAPAGRGPGP